MTHGFGYGFCWSVLDAVHRRADGAAVLAHLRKGGLPGDLCVARLHPGREPYLSVLVCICRLANLIEGSREKIRFSAARLKRVLKFLMEAVQAIKSFRTRCCNNVS